jgi:Arc/MetJ-type ribon-helix-helix transcriptional regulator
VVYSDVVAGRTQVYLGDEELELLDRVGRATGASRSELIRRAVRATFGRTSAEARVAALERAQGLWRDRELSGADYVDRVRGDLNERLARLGLE